MGAHTGLPGVLGQLARAVGGIGPLARLLGVHPTTLRYWAKVRPPTSARLLLARVAAEHHLPADVQHALTHYRE